MQIFLGPPNELAGYVPPNRVALRGQVAQSVEQGIENPCVASSILALTTILWPSAERRPGTPLCFVSGPDHHFMAFGRKEARYSALLRFWPWLPFFGLRQRCGQVLRFAPFLALTTILWPSAERRPGTPLCFVSGPDHHFMAFGKSLSVLVFSGRALRALSISVVVMCEGALFGVFG